MDLENIKQQTTWNDAAESINSNFAKVDIEIEKLKNVTTRDKGYYDTVEALNEAHPVASAGSRAFVGYTPPYSVWVWDKDSASWVDSGESFSDGQVTIDSEMSDTSVNPAQNKVIKSYIDNAVAKAGVGAVIFDATCSTDPWNLNQLQTETTLEEMTEAINNGSPIYMRFGSGLVAVANAELYENGDVSLYVHLVDSESEIVRTIHTYSTDGGWAWESTDNPMGGGGEVDTAMSAISTNAVQNKVIKAYVDKAETRAYDNAIVDAGRYTDSQVASKAGAFYLVPESNLFLAFTTEEAKNEYITTGSTDQSNILFQQVIQGGGGSGDTTDTYRMTILGLEGFYNYTTASETMPISCTFKSEVKRAGEDTYEVVPEAALFTVVVYKSTGTVSTVANGVIVNSGGTFNFDLKPYVGNGENTVTVKATGLISSKDGNTFTKVNVTTMSLAPFGFAWYDAWKQGQDYLIRLKVQGALNKTLHVQINGNEITESLGTFSSDSTPKDFTLKSSYHPAATGVYNMKIWMTADASGVPSDVLTYNIMCVKSSDVNTAKLVCINEVATFADNYAESKLFSYATYNGGGASSTPTLSITKGSTTIVSNTASATTGVAYDFTYAFSLDMSESTASIVAKAVFGNTQSATITLRNETAFAPVGGYSFYMDAATRSNLDAYKTYLQNEANSQRVSASWTDMAWVDGMDGWTTDDEGNKCLLIPAMSKANVNFAPMQNISTITIEMFYKVKNVSDFDEEIITIATATTSSWMGVKIKPTNICLHSRLLFSDDLKQSYNVQDEKPVHLVIAVNSNYLEHGNVAIIYVNGVKKCTFEWGANDSFAHNGNLMLGSSTADLYLYKIRVYGFQFDWPQVMQNYISCLTTAADKSKTKRREDSVLDDNNQVDYDKVYGKYNTFVVELPKGAVLPNRKDNSSNIPVEGSNLYINIVQDPSCSIQGEFLNVPLEGQGTTAMTYYRWNLRSKTDTIRITAKKNVASSMQSHKRGATALYNDLNLALVGANDANGRVAVYQYPVYGFQKIEYEDTPGTYYYDFIGLYTIGPDKGDKPTFGYDNSTYKSSLIHMEGTDHSPRGVGMDYPWELMTVGLNKSGDTCLGSATFGGVFSAAWEIGACCNKEDDDFTGIKEDLDREFAPAYKIDYECTPMIVGLPLGDTIEDANADISNFRAQNADNGFAYSDCIIYDNDYYTYYYDEVSKTYVKDGRMVYSGLTSAHGYSKSTLDSKSSVLAKTQYIRECRKARYRAEMEQYWHLNDSIFHACFLDLIGATDNEKKNSYPYKFKPLASQGKWRWRQDDLDTIFDVNNQGFADKKYSILNTDKLGSTMIFKGNTSYHWRCIREYYKNEMKAMMQRIFAKMVELCPSGYGSSNIQKLVGCIRHYFWDYAQEYFTGGAYNLDARWTYEDAWRIGAPNAVPVLQQSLGSHYEAEVAWVTMRMLFLASMYEFGAFSDYQDSSEGQIKFRQGGDFTFTLTPAVDMRPAIASGQSVVIYASGRVLAGNSVAIATSSETGADTDVYIQGADWMQDVGDFSTVTVGSQAQPFEVASKRLQKLKVGDATASKVTTNIARMAIHECPSLIEIDARNITALANTVDLTKCPRLRRAYFGGTSLTSITLPEGSKIQAYGLPSTIQSLELRKLPLLTTSGLIYDDLNALTYVWVEDNKNLDGYDLLKNALEDGSPLNNIRVIGFNKTATAEDTDFLLELANGEYHGITPTGTADNTIPPVLVGTVNYDIIDGDVYDALTNAYGSNLTINYNKLIALIKFADPDVLAKLLANGIGSDGGVTREQAAAVTTLPSFYNDQTIDYFDELQYFTGVTQIGPSNSTNGGFLKAINLKSIVLPSSVKTIGFAAFQETAISSINLDNVTTILSCAFQLCSNLKQVNAPNLTDLQYTAFASSGIEEIVSLGKITKLVSNNSSQGTFAICESLAKANLTGITQFGQYEFYRCAALHTVTIDWTKVTTIGNDAFNGCTSLSFDYLNLASLTTLGGNAFYGVKIKKLILGNVSSLPPASSSQNYGDYNTLEEVTIRGSVTTLPYNSFANYKALKTADIGNITVLKWSGFQNASSLQSIDLSKVTEMDSNSFNGCTSLTMEINMPQLVTLIGTGHFRNSGITAFIAPNITDIPQQMFTTCKGLQRVEVGAINTVGTQAFTNCTQLTTITNLSTCTSVGSDAFNGCSVLEGVNLGSSLTLIGNTAFRNCAAFDAVLNCTGLTSLGTQAFNYSGITRIDSLGHVTNIPNQCFSRCSSLTSVNLMNIVTTGFESFSYCTSLTGVLNMPNATSIGESSFRYTALTEISLPSVVTIGTAAFGNITTLTKVNIKNATTIGNQSFGGCTALTSVELGENTAQILYAAFSTCSSLTALICRATTPPTIGSQILSNSNNAIIYVPDASVATYQAADGWSTYASRIRGISEYNG